ncbi:MAG: rhombosortase [Pseudomonadales bacterium]|jgi:rhomboid family GlyGly-CTERM serine protease|nr:rhombosortase [Pseudomonadales bacterium]
MRGANSPRAPWLTLAPLLLSGVFLLLPEAALEHLTLTPQGVFAGQWWRLWTGHFVHFSLTHALADGGVILLCGWYCERRCKASVYAALWLCAPPLLSALLLLTAPSLHEYRGASGLAMSFALIAGLTLWREQPRWRTALLCLSLIFAAKTLLDALHPPFNTALSGLPADVEVVWQAHLIGALLGVGGFFALRKTT